ncbi:MAG: hypothetical protein GY820_35960 [Gammaproteobacteria bacterium]|nr:hypothetical protein [Gammaproteobacteria bacterium]
MILAIESELLHFAAYPGVWEFGPSEFESVEWQEIRFSPQFLLIKLTQNPSTHPVRVHDVVEQPDMTRQTHTHTQTNVNLSECTFNTTRLKIAQRARFLKTS